MSVKINSLFLLWFFLSTSFSSYSQKLVIYDEFDSALNTKVWLTSPTWGPNMNVKYDPQIFVKQNVITEDGKLKLFLRNEPGCYDTWRYCDSANCDTSCVSKFKDPKCPGKARCEVQGNHCLCLVPKYYEYTAGMVFSEQAFKYGIFEVKCKIPADVFPAYWLFGDCCSEIDIFEFMGCEKDNFSTTVHECPQRNCSNTLTCGENLKTLKSSFRPDFTKDFYTWKLDWKPESLTVYVNDHLIYTCNAKGPGACLYNMLNTSGGSCTIGTHTLYADGPMHILLNTATNPNDCTPPKTSVFEIEYIKVWQY